MPTAPPPKGCQIVRSSILVTHAAKTGHSCRMRSNVTSLAARLPRATLLYPGTRLLILLEGAVSGLSLICSGVSKEFRISVNRSALPLSPILRAISAGITEKKAFEFIHGNERDKPCRQFRSMAGLKILRERILNMCSFLRDINSRAP